MTAGNEGQWRPGIRPKSSNKGKSSGGGLQPIVRGPSWSPCFNGLSSPHVSTGPDLVRDKLKWRPQAFAVVRRRLRVLGAVCDLAG